MQIYGALLQPLQLYWHRTVMYSTSDRCTASVTAVSLHTKHEHPESELYLGINGTDTRL